MSVRVLAIETALSKCSVAVVRDGTVVAVSEHAAPRAHAEQLVPMISRCTTDAGLKIGDIDVIAVSSGPGSYTGLRIGVSTAKGICFATGASLVAVPTLKAMASRANQARAVSDSHQATVSNLVAVAMRARADELYWAVFDFSAEGTRVVTDTCVLEIGDVVQDLLSVRRRAGHVLLCGTAAKVVTEAVANRPPDGAVISTEAQAVTDKMQVADPAETPLSATIGMIGHAKYAEGDTVDHVTFEPAYLKEFVAAKRKGSIFDQLRF